MQQRLAIRQAEKSQFRHRVGAVITKGNKVLGVGVNSLRHQGSIHSQHWPGSLHAEVAAIIAVMKHHPASSLKGAEMTVVGGRKDGSLGLSLPCADCYKVIASVGIKRVYFSTDQQTFSEIRI